MLDSGGESERVDLGGRWELTETVVIYLLSTASTLFMFIYLRLKV